MRPESEGIGARKKGGGEREPMEANAVPSEVTLVTSFDCLDPSLAPKTTLCEAYQYVSKTSFWKGVQVHYGARNLPCGHINSLAEITDVATR